MKDFYIQGHLGLGDHFLTNAIVREYAKRHESVKIPCYNHNAPTVAEMFSDLKEVEVVGVKDDAESILMCDRKKCLKLGYYSEPFNPSKFDSEFYRQAGMSFSDRWSKFKISEKCEYPQELDELSIFVHDDEERGFKIFDKFLPSVDPKYIHRLKSKLSLGIIVKILSYSEEIHCINSSMLILADSVPTPWAKKLVLHKYARPTVHPILKKNWEIL